MKQIELDDVRLAYVERGTGEETVVLSHSYLVDHRQYEAQIEALAERYRVLAFDHRAHGQSSRPPGPYSMDQICRDAERFIEATDAGPCHWVGLSAGGFVGMRLARRRPELLRSLVLMDTAANAEALPKRLKYEAMFAVAQSVGFDPLLDTVMKIMFGPTFLSDPARRGEAQRWRAHMAGGDVDSLVRFGQAIFSREDLRAELAAIDLPTLVMVGEHDAPQPVARSQEIADGIPGAKLQVIPKAGHLSTIENPDFVTAALLSFFATGQLPTASGEPDNARTPRSALYDGRLYGHMVEPLLRGVHGFVAERLPEGSRVLDACCGTGGLARRIAGTGREVVGVDLSPANVAFARERHPDLRFEVGDVAQLPYDDGAFDAATIVMALHEMPQACRASVLRELGRVAQRVVVVDFAAPMPLNAAGLRNRAVEFAAGRDHFGAFLDYQRRGGLDPLFSTAGLKRDDHRLIDADTLAVDLVARG